MANNITVRSNCFAMWCTVGFFEVDNQGRLGREIGALDGMQKRHRFFAVLDRSVLDPWIQGMNALTQITTGGQWNYDVAQGAVRVALGVNQPTVVIPLLGNPNYDPRKDYSSLPFVPSTAWPPASGTPPGWNPGQLPPSGPPPTCLYWSIIQ